MNPFIGKWVAETGRCLVIEPTNEPNCVVSLYSETGKPIFRPYCNKETISMPAVYDEDEGTLEVDLWDREKGFSLELSLIYDPDGNIEISPGLSCFEEDDYVENYGDIFDIFHSFTKVED